MDDTSDAQFFDPDRPFSSPDVRRIVVTLRQHDLERTWAEGRGFISSLSNQILCDRDVAHAVSSFYSAHGHYSKAKHALARTNINFESLDDDSLQQNLQLSCLFLDSASLGVQCDCEFRKALEAVRRIERLYWPEGKVSHSKPRIFVV